MNTPTLKSLTVEQRMTMRARLRDAGIVSRGMNDAELQHEFSKLDINSSTTVKVSDLIERELESKKIATATDTDQIQQALETLLSLVNKPTQPQIDEKQLVALIKKHATITHQIKIQPAQIGEVKTINNAHPKLMQVISFCECRNGDGTRMNAYLYGPAGSGKTTMGVQVSEALDLDFYSMGAVLTPYELVGNLDAHGKYSATAFYHAYKNGGVFLQDEIDACSPRALLCINQALANDRYTFPNAETVKRHKDFIYIAGANTIGSGATLEYIGRGQLDKATIDRFFQIEIEYNESVERNICYQTAAINGADIESEAVQKLLNDWLSYIAYFRKTVSDLGLKIVISPRTTARGAALIARGFSTIDVKDLVIINTLSTDNKKALGL